MSYRSSLRNLSPRSAFVAIAIASTLILSGCSSDGDEPAAADTPVEEGVEVEAVETDDGALAFTDEDQPVDPDAPVAVAVEEVFSSAGANDELVDCYSAAYGEHAGITEITSFSELKEVDITPELQAALNGCVDIANGG